MLISVESLKKWYSNHQEEILKDFFSFLRFPSISTDPDHARDSRDTAQWLCEYLDRIGLEACLWETPGFPVVFASYLQPGPKRPTVLIYHHYDVQPVDPLDLWKSDPFKPEVRNNQVYARGALDNKGQCFYTLTALKAIFELAKEVDLNLKIFIEGEEESGGRGTSAILEEKKPQLQADHLLVVDFDIPESQTPAVTVGMRGIVTMNIECSNSFIDLHSGVHGGIALNPNRVLASLLTSIWDETGRIAIPHFYDEVCPLSEEHLSHIDMSFDLQKYQKAFGVKALCKEEGYSLMESNWLRPVIEINGMWGGYIGPGFKTVIPSKAYAKLSSRLVPNQEPEVIGERISEFLKMNAPEGVEIKIGIDHGAPGYRSALDSTTISNTAAAFSEIFEKKCRYQFSGASVPIVADLAKVSCAQVAMIGVGLASDDIHAPNEHFGLDRFELGYLVMARTLVHLSSEDK